MLRQIVLDTETTGLEVTQGHRVIEVGCVELLNRRLSGNNFWKYINPERLSDPGAVAVHGIKDDFLADKPKFAEIAQDLWNFLEGAELVIHNSAFDVGFLDAEFERVGIGRKLSEACSIVDTVSMARRMHPGQKANLDALCKRYGIDNSNRSVHGALLDAGLLAEVYLAMTGGQSALSLDSHATAGVASGFRFAELLGVTGREPLPVVEADEAELAAHVERLKVIRKKAGKLLWAGELPD